MSCASVLQSKDSTSRDVRNVPIHRGLRRYVVHECTYLLAYLEAKAEEYGTEPVLQFMYSRDLNDDT